MTDLGTEPTASAEKHAGSGWTRYALWLLLAAAIVGLDQVSKLAIIRWVELYERIPITSFANITHHHNEGAAFSFLADAGGWQRWFFAGLASVVSLVIVIWLGRIRNQRLWALSLGLSLVLGGAIGNLIDRVRLGYVTDFIQVLIFGWPFPSFNLADAAITVGAVFLIIDALFFSGRPDAAEKTAAQKKAP